MSSYIEAESTNTKLAEHLRRMADAIGTIELLQPLSAKVLARSQEVQADRFSMLVVGSFSRGKSTLLNAMLGREILPQEVVPSTAVITLIRYDEHPRAIVHFKDGRPADTLTLEQFRKEYMLRVIEEPSAPDREEDDLPQLTEEQLAKMAADRFAHVDYAELCFDLELCRHRVQLIDSPGFDDDSARTARARLFLEKADAIVYVLDPGHAMTLSDTRHLRWIAAQGKTELFFVANKWDLAEAMARRNPEGLHGVIDRFRKHLTEYTTIDGRDCFEERFFRSNALGALTARETVPEDKAALDASGLPKLVGALEHFLANDRTRARNRAVLADARNYAQETGEFIKRAFATQARSLEQLKATQSAIEPKLARLRRIRGHIREFLDNRALRIHRTLVDSLREQMSRVDTHKLVFEKLDLSVIEGCWLNWVAITNWTRKEENRFENRVARQIEPQVQNFLEREKVNWEANAAAWEMKREGAELVKYLQSEAEDYRQVLAEIDTLLGTEESKPLDVNQLVSRWMQTSMIGKAKVNAPTLNMETFTLELGPIIGGIAADVLLQIKGMLVPIVGTIVAVVIGFVRNRRGRENIKKAIAEALDGAFKAIPDTAQSQQLCEHIQASFDTLKELVTRNMNREIEQIKNELEDAIAKLERGTLNAAAERQRLEKVRGVVGEALASVQQLCVGS